MDIFLTHFFWVGLLAASIRILAPILYAALGEIFVERSGVLNIGIEGMMLMGGFAGWYGTYLTGNPWVGSLIGVGVAGLTGLILAYLCVSRGVDQIICGLALNIFCLGVTSLAYNRVVHALREPPKIRSFETLPIPYLSDIPYLGRILFQHVSLVYLALLLVPLTALLLGRTTWGLKIRAVGEHPRAADTAGVNVHLCRYLCTVGGALLAGLGGVALSVGQLSVFVENMTAGRGFIALAVVIFGKWNPYQVLGASFLFAFIDALQLRLQALGFKIPFQFLLMLPYLFTIVVLAGVVGKAAYPASTGIPYLKPKRRRPVAP